MVCSKPNATKSEAVGALRDWTKLYAERRANLEARSNGPAMVRADSVFTYLEGVARYVENRFLVDPKYHPNLTVTHDARFHSFRAHLNKGYEGMPAKRLGARYYYALGMHLGLVLDRVDSSWTQRVHDDPDFIIGLVHKLVESG